MDLLTALVLGAYAFTSGAYVFVWWVFQQVGALAIKVASLCERVDNHFQHELSVIRQRLDDLERR